MWRDTNNRLGKKRKLCVEAEAAARGKVHRWRKRKMDDAQKSFFGMRAK